MTDIKNSTETAPVAEAGGLAAKLDQIFEGAAVVSTVRAFKALDIAKTKGHELINSGLLERVHIGRASRISVESIMRLAANGTPPASKPAPKPKAPQQRPIRRPGLTRNN